MSKGSPIVRSDMIKKALFERASKRRAMFFTEVMTNGIYGPFQRFDGVEIPLSWTNQAVLGYEIKVSRSDFLADNKWTGYLPHCHEFYFVCPDKLIAQNELPLEAGLIYYNPDKGTLRMKRKALHREIEFPHNVIMSILINRINPERHPFFSSQREQIITYLQDKEERTNLGLAFQSKLVAERDEALEAASKEQRELERYKSDSEILGEVIKALKESGLSVWGKSDAVCKVRQILQSGHEQQAIAALRQAEQILGKALRAVGD